MTLLCNLDFFCPRLVKNELEIWFTHFQENFLLIFARVVNLKELDCLLKKVEIWKNFQMSLEASSEVILLFAFFYDLISHSS